VTEVLGRRVFVDGAELDPLADGAPHTVEVPARSTTRAPLDPGAWRSYELEPLADPTQPCYLALRLARGKPGKGFVFVRWSRGEELLGTLAFEIRRGHAGLPRAPELAVRLDARARGPHRAERHGLAARGRLAAALVG
jgi:hypothetical protein